MTIVLPAEQRSRPSRQPAGGGGSQWTSAPRAPTGADTGTPGDEWLNTANGDVYMLGSSAWVLTGNIRGPQGLQGDTGEPGAGATLEDRTGTGGSAGALPARAKLRASGVLRATDAGAVADRIDLRGPAFLAPANGPSFTVPAAQNAASGVANLALVDPDGGGTIASFHANALRCNVACRLRFYARDADRIADAGRAQPVDPALTAGVLLEVIVTAAFVNADILFPVPVDLYALDASSSTGICLLDGGPANGTTPTVLLGGIRRA